MSRMGRLAVRIREVGAAEILKQVSNKIMRCKTVVGRERLRLLAPVLTGALGVRL